MIDPTQMSDADLMAAINAAPAAPASAPQNVGAMVTAEAQRQGVDPALALAVARQESNLNPNAVSPHGAIGVMQLMPGTAQDLGVDPHDVAQNIHGGISYLKDQLDTFKDPRLALAAYNAGPGAVQKAGGIPNIPETQAYVNSVMGDASVSKMSDADLAKALGIPLPASEDPQQNVAQTAPTTPSAPVVVVNPETGKPYNDAQQRAYAQLIKSGQLDPHSAPGSQDFPRGLTDPHDSPDPGSWYVDLQGNVKQAPGVDYQAEAAQGFMAPWRQLGHDVAQDYRDTMAGKAPVMGTPRIALDALGAIPGSLMGLVTRPLAAGASQALPTPYTPSHLTMNNGVLSVVRPQALHGQNAVSALQDAVNTALGTVRPAAPAAAAAAPMSLDELRAAKNAAYGKVDASGFTLPQADVQNLAKNVSAAVAEKGGPSAARLYPRATAVAERLQALAQQPNGIPLSQLDTLRSDIYEQLVKPGDHESPMGKMMRAGIDDVINGAKAPYIDEARDLNTRYMKAKAISDRIDSAGLRSASTYSGGNYQNAARQALRPLIDPTSSQQIANLTPAETTALKQAVTGTPAQNAMRYLSKFLTNKIVQAPMAVVTHGWGQLPMEAAGQGLNKVGQLMTNGALDRVLALVSAGGQGATDAAPYPTLALGGRPAVPLVSPRGLVGANVIVRPSQQAPSAGR